MPIAQILVSLLPVFVFLAALVFLDSYKLVKLRSILQTIFAGWLAAALCLMVNSWLLKQSSLEITFYSRYVSPIIEELVKAAYLVYLIKATKVGFMVDGAIYGFALGAGFAFIENVYYVQALQNSNLLLWIVRGFGTAIMHGGTTAIAGIIAKNLTDRRASGKLYNFLPGLGVAIFVHSVFNQFILPPLVTTLSLLITLPLLIIMVFDRSEKSLQNWLGVGFDTDMALLEMIISGDIADTRIGKYLQTLKAKFSGAVVADMLCFLRIHLELSVSAKGMLLMHEAGFRAQPTSEVKEKFEELTYLEKSIGKTGSLVMLPFLHKSNRDLWQLHMLGKK